MEVITKTNTTTVDLKKKSQQFESRILLSSLLYINI